MSKKKKFTGKLRKLLTSVKAVIKLNNDLHAKKRKVISKSHRNRRKSVIMRFCQFLHQVAGFPILNVAAFKEKHFHAYFQWRIDSGSAPSTMQTEHSILRTFCTWINKPGLIDRALSTFEHEAQYRQQMKRSLKDWTPKTWSSQHVDPADKLIEVYEDDPNIAVQLMLMWFFGMRAAEAMRFRPYLGDHGDTISIEWACKGNRPRYGIQVDTDIKRELLEQAKLFANSTSGSTIPDDKSFPSWRNYFYRVTARHGLTRANGLVPHGLRHEFALDDFEKHLREHDDANHDNISQIIREAFYYVSRDLGHNRREITTHYLGPVIALRKALRQECDHS